MRFPRLVPLVSLALVLALGWAGQARSVAESEAAPDLERGAALYAMCEQCHGPDGEGSALLLAPSIAGLEPWYIEVELRKFRSGARGEHPADVAGLRMRPMSRWLTGDPDIAAVAAYIGSMQSDFELTLDGDAAKGAATYALCSACHAADGSGNQTMSAPSLTRTSDWYQLTQLENFKKGVRGGAKDPEGALMRGFATMLADDQAMKDVIAHVMTLRK
jgi:cytochrome c oxidase subunit 2